MQLQIPSTKNPYTESITVFYSEGYLINPLTLRRKEVTRELSSRMDTGKKELERNDTKTATTRLGR